MFDCFDVESLSIKKIKQLNIYKCFPEKEVCADNLVFQEREYNSSIEIPS